MKMMPTQQSAYTEALIEEIGGNAQVCTSYAFTDKYRRIVNSDTVEEIRETWTPPMYASLHWDSKLLPKLADKYTTEERLTVAVGTQDEIEVTRCAML